MKFLYVKNIADFYGLTMNTVYRLVKKNILPPCIQHGGKVVLSFDAHKLERSFNYAKL